MKKLSRAFFIAMFSFIEPLSAADFTFNVPVKVKNMAANFTGGKVHCEVTSGKTSPLLVGSGEQFFLLNNLGGFEDELIIPVNAQEGKDPASATAWNCRLWFRGASGSFISPNAHSNYLVGSHDTTSISGELR